MKNKVLLNLLLLSFSFGYAQNYKFDNVVWYTLDYGIQHGTYYNQKNFSYAMRFLQHGTATTALLTDMNSNLHHFYTVNKIEQANGDTLFDFRYTHSSVNKNYMKKFGQEYEVETLQHSADSTGVKLKIYRGSKRKRPLHVALLQLKPHTKNVFPVIKFVLMDTALNLIDFKYPQNVIVASAEYMMNGNRLTYTHDSVADANFLVPMPKKIIFK
jgi:hypothetical protein